MQIFELVRVDDPNSFLKPGIKFFILDGILYPTGCNNGVGLEMDVLGLDNPETFNLYFKEVEARPGLTLPMVKTMHEELPELEAELQELEADVTRRRDRIIWLKSLGE